MSPLALLKSISCPVVVFRSPWISLVERSRSSFDLIVSYVQMRSFFLFPAMPTMVASGRSNLKRVGHHTGMAFSSRAKRMF
jgi:hypothetical protein